MKFYLKNNIYRLNYAWNFYYILNVISQKKKIYFDVYWIGIIIDKCVMCAKMLSLLNSLKAHKTITESKKQYKQ